MIKSAYDIVVSSASYDVGLPSRGKVQRQQRSCNESIRCSISYFLFTSLLNSKLFDLNFLLNRFSKKSAANFNSVVNILEILFFLSATARGQSLNCSSVLLSLKLSCSRVRWFKLVNFLRE